ncbi:MAG: hypothetical protein U1D35_09915 [Paracoccaceae bacterium]|nr:hypothetical protein [Paracoccaceae bacterium]
MKFTALRTGSTATITRQEINNVTAIRLYNADNIGAQLLDFISPYADPVDTPAYRIDPTDAGLRITCPTGQIDLPWRWISSIGAALT